MTILQALDSPTMYNRARENLDNVKWPDVTAGTRKNGKDHFPAHGVAQGYFQTGQFNVCRKKIHPFLVVKDPVVISMMISFSGM